MNRKVEHFDLFEESSGAPLKRLAIEDADVTLYKDFLSQMEADRIYSTLLSHTAWQQDSIVMYGKSIPLPRLTAWYGDAGKTYTYSGIPMSPQPWTEDLMFIKAHVEGAAGVIFTSVLLNLYRTGQDSVNWHSDDEKELGTNPLIASVSLGARRTFQMRHKQDEDASRVEIPLPHGSLLVMKGTTQAYWKHQIPKTSRPVEPRINLTFRVIH